MDVLINCIIGLLTGIVSSLVIGLLFLTLDIRVRLERTINRYFLIAIRAYGRIINSRNSGTLEPERTLEALAGVDAEAFEIEPLLKFLNADDAKRIGGVKTKLYELWTFYAFPESEEFWRNGHMMPLPWDNTSIADFHRKRLRVRRDLFSNLRMEVTEGVWKSPTAEQIKASAQFGNILPRVALWVFKELTGNFGSQWLEYVAELKAEQKINSDRLE